MMIHRLQENESVLKNFHALSELIRSRPNGYFEGFIPGESVGFQAIMAANAFAAHLNKSPLEIEDIYAVDLDARGDIHYLIVRHHVDDYDVWTTDYEDARLAKDGFDILKFSIEKSAKKRQPASYKIEQGLLRTSNGGDMWDGIVDLDAYDHF